MSGLKLKNNNNMLKKKLKVAIDFLLKLVYPIHRLFNHKKALRFINIKMFRNQNSWIKPNIL